MPHELIGDRFLSDGSGRWIDLATGGIADVIVRSVESGWPAIEERLREEFYASRAIRLVDYGLVNARQWFEARAWAGARALGRARCAHPSAVDAIVCVAEASGPGVRHVPIVSRGSEMARVVEEMARRLRPLGFVTVRADIEMPDTIRSALTHRHVVVHCRSGSERDPVIRWIRQLSQVSPRAHLVVELSRDLQMARSAIGSDLVAGANWNARVSAATREAHALIARSRLERAEALLVSVEAEAAVLRERLPGVVNLAWARLRTRQGRDEEARRRLAAGLAGVRVEERMDGVGSSDSGIAATGSRR